MSWISVDFCKLLGGSSGINRLSSQGFGLKEFILNNFDLFISLITVGLESSDVSFNKLLVSMMSNNFISDDQNDSDGEENECSSKSKNHSNQ